MKNLKTLLLALLIPWALPAHAQEQTFIFKLYGGLFFPSNAQFHDLYKSNSEAIWGGGVSLPMGSYVFLDGDIGIFRASTYLDPGSDSSAALEENIIHVGLLHKQQIGRLLFFRATAGLNYITIREKVTSPRSPDVVIEGDKKTGYYAGIGMERMVESGQASIFADLMYDYRRSHRQELEGDFGGVRLIIGLHIILF